MDAVAVASETGLGNPVQREITVGVGVRRDYNLHRPERHRSVDERMNLDAVPGLYTDLWEGFFHVRPVNNLQPVAGRRVEVLVIHGQGGFIKGLAPRPPRGAVTVSRFQTGVVQVGHHLASIQG